MPAFVWRLTAALYIDQYKIETAHLSAYAATLLTYWCWIFVLVEATRCIAQKSRLQIAATRTFKNSFSCLQKQHTTCYSYVQKRTGTYYFCYRQNIAVASMNRKLRYSEELQSYRTSSHFLRHFTHWHNLAARMWNPHFTRDKLTLFSRSVETPWCMRLPICD